MSAIIYVNLTKFDIMDPMDNQMVTIEWEMMDKKRFFAFSAVNSVGIRFVIYPLTVIKTRLQVTSSQW